MPVAAARIGAPILEKSAPEQVVTGPVLVPGRADRERHQYTAENIRKIATSFLPRGEVDAMHGGGAVGHPIENYVTRSEQEFEVGGEKRTIPTGSWMLSAKVTDERVWRGVERDKLTGFSVFGPVRSIFDDEGEEIDVDEVAVPIGEGGGSESAVAVAANSIGAGGYAQQIPAAPVGETWTVEFERATHVSLIDDPAVWDARFIVAKSAGSRASGWSGAGSASGANQEITMNDELEERLTAIQKEASASAEAAQDAADSAEAAQEAAENAESDSDDDGGGDGEIGALREEVGALREDVSDLLDGDVEDDDGGEGGSGDSGSNGGGDGDALDAATVQRLVDEGALSEDELSDLDVEVSGVSVEKRLTALEKAYQQGGRRGRASALDGYGAGSDDRESETGGSISAALAGGEQGGDGQ